MAPLKPLEDKLYEEIVGAHQAGRRSGAVPRARLLVLHALRDRQGLSDPRPPQGRDGANAQSMLAASQKPDADEEVLLDVNALAKGKDYYKVGDWEVSQDNGTLAWADDTIGRRQYTIRFKDLATGESMPTRSRASSANMVWADDNRTLFYIENDPETLLDRARQGARARHAGAQDRLVYEETDDSFYMGIVAHPRRQVHLHRRQQHRVRRAALHAGGRAGRVRRAGAARARRRVRRRPPRRPLGDPHQLRTSAELPLMRSPTPSRLRLRATMEGLVRAPRRRLHRGLRAVRRLHRDRRALRRPGAHAPAEPGRQSEYVAADEPAYAMGLTSTPSRTRRGCATATPR